MPHIACILTRLLAPVLGPALVVAALGCRDDAESPTAPEAQPALDITPAAALLFRQVSAGSGHTCGVTTDNQAYCWGLNGGTLGDGTTNQSLTPVAVAGALRFRQVSAGSAHTCGVTTDDRAYCWGENSLGQLGNGTTGDRSLTPVAVAGGLRFRHVSAGSGHSSNEHTCGVTTDDRAYCWGGNGSAQLGDGTTTDRPSPVAVAGGLKFRQVSAGGTFSGGKIGSGSDFAHTCGVTTSDRAYCWGDNVFGELGAGITEGGSLTPVAVAGGLSFRLVSAGGRHTCGVTTANLAYCWGANSFGQLGDGTNHGPERCFGNYCSSRPVAVAGARRFDRVSAGGAHTCAVTPFDRAFCWGANARGQLGDGTITTDRPTPVRVVGGLLFTQVNAGKFRHTCGVTIDKHAYCWGQNDLGELGDGTLHNRERPTPVAGTTSTSSGTTSTSPTTSSNQVGVDEPNGDAGQE
ncbi:MAG: RCC1 domain-containing protein [Gemmatimonadales bacterium]